MSRYPSPILLVAVAASALVLAGCAAPGTSSELKPEDSPLVKYLDALYGGAGDQDEFNAQQKEIEEAVAACMAEEGFDYVPIDYSSQDFSGPSPEDFEDTNTEEWVAANGYGMSQPEQSEEQQEPAEEFVDPNQEYIESLSPSEQTAYFNTLHGVPPTDEELGEDGSYEYKWEDAGCYGAAQHEIQGDNPYEDEKHRELFDALDSMYQDLQSDPAISALDAKWASCMADAEYPDLKQKQDAFELAIEKQNEFYKDDGSTGPTDEQLAEAREFEIDVALADFRCSEKVRYNDTMMEVQFALERQFIQDHKSELDALLADAEQGK